MVTAFNATEKSRPSEMFRFVPSEVPTNITMTTTETKANEEWFDLSGRKVPESGATKGIYIVRKGNLPKKVVRL